MITAAEMVRVTRKGGSVTHLALSDGVPSLCGRVAYGSAGDSRLCKTCSKIGKVGEVMGEWTDTEKVFISLPRTSEQWEMLSDVISDYEGGEENSVKRIALYRAALATRNYKTTIITNHSDAHVHNGDGSVIGGGKAKRLTGATENQRIALRKMAAFVDSLFSQLFELQGKPKDDGSTLAEMTDEWFDGLKRDAIDQQFKMLSSLIERLKQEVYTLKNAERQSAVKESGIQEDEIFVLDGEYYKTKKSKADNLYAMRWDGGAWDYASAKGVIRKLTPEMRATAEQAAKFGHTYHCCVYCSRGLTDSRSETVGYGPRCAENYGLPWGE